MATKRGKHPNQRSGSGTARDKKSPWHGKGKGRWRRVTLRKPPPGTYDIGLDQSLRASQRGLSDLIGDIAPIDLTERQKLLGKKSKAPAGTMALRDYFDFKLAGGENARQRGYLNRDYTTGVGRENLGFQQSMEDLLAQRQTLQRNYGQLANQQRQGFQAAGLAEGGASAQAAAKRAANLAVETKPIDVAQQRTGIAHQQSLEDMLTQQQRGTADLNSQLGQVNLTYGRGVQDRASQLERARREARKYGEDIAQTKITQYTQGGGRTSRRVGVKKYRKWRKLGVV